MTSSIWRSTTLTSSSLVTSASATLDPFNRRAYETDETSQQHEEEAHGKHQLDKGEATRPGLASSTSIKCRVMVCAQHCVGELLGLLV